MNCGLIHINKDDLGSGCFSWNCIDSFYIESYLGHKPASSSLSSSSSISLHKPRTPINQSSQVLQEIKCRRDRRDSNNYSDTKSRSSTWTCTGSKTCKIYRHYWANAENIAEAISLERSKLTVLWHWWKIFLQGQSIPKVAEFLGRKCL